MWKHEFSITGLCKLNAINRATSDKTSGMIFIFDNRHLERVDGYVFSWWNITCRSSPDQARYKRHSTKWPLEIFLGNHHIPDTGGIGGFQ